MFSEKGRMSWQHMFAWVHRAALLMAALLLMPVFASNTSLIRGQSLILLLPTLPVL